MRQISRWFVFLFLLTTLVALSGCKNAAPASVTPSPIPPPPTALILPTRPAATATAASQPATPAPSPTEPQIATPTPDESATSETKTEIFGWAYVITLQTSLYDHPGGRALTALQAGDRLDILGASATKKWMKVRYQPAPEAEAITGWVPVWTTQFYIDLDKLPIADTTVPNNTTPVPASEVVAKAIVQAQKLNLRTGPGMDHPIIGELMLGQEVGIIGRSDNNEWLQVRLNDGRTGWAAQIWLKTDKSPSDLPVTGNATTTVPKPAPAPTASKMTGRIVFQESSGGPIYLMNGDGTGLQQITTGMDPTFSPDGGRITFARWTGQKGIWVLNLADGSQRLGFGDEHARSPSWTPDGQTLVMERLGDYSWACRETPLGCHTDQEIRDFFGGNDCRDFGFFGVYCITDFAKDEHIIVNQEITEINLNTGEVRMLPVPKIVSAPRHHPTNPEVMVLLPDGIGVVYDQDSRPPRKIVTASYLGAPVYSPDGRYIYVSHRVGDHWDIWRYNEDGANPVSLTRPPDLRDRPIHNVAPAVSPDGSSILFLTNREGDGSQWKLWIMNSDGSNQRPFAPQALANIHFRFDFGKERVIDWR